MDWKFGKHIDDGPQWPTNENGAVPEAVAAVMSDTQLGVTTAVTMLHAFGIPARVRYPGDGTFGRIVLGFSGYGAEILVPEDRLEEAAALLETDAAEDIDREISEEG